MADLFINWLGELANLRYLKFTGSNVPIALTNMKKLGSFLDKHKTV